MTLLSKIRQYKGCVIMPASCVRVLPVFVFLPLTKTVQNLVYLLDTNKKFEQNYVLFFYKTFIDTIFSIIREYDQYLV